MTVQCTRLRTPPQPGGGHFRNSPDDEDRARFERRKRLRRGRRSRAPFEPETHARRRPRYRRSRLDRYKGELLALRAEGCTTAELQRWLLARRVRVQHATVARWLRRHGAG